MNDKEKLSCLTDRPCTACKFHKEEGCSKWSCVFEEKSGDTEGKYIKIDDLDDTILRLNNDGWEITRNEHKLISNVLYEMPLYSFPDREKKCSECIHSAERDGEFCYECVKGNEDNFVSAEGEYIKKSSAKSIILNRPNRREMIQALKELPTYSFPEREKGTLIGDDDINDYYFCPYCGSRL